MPFKNNVHSLRVRLAIAEDKLEARPLIGFIGEDVGRDKFREQLVRLSIEMRGVPLVVVDSLPTTVAETPMGLLEDKSLFEHTVKFRTPETRAERRQRERQDKN